MSGRLPLSRGRRIAIVLGFLVLVAVMVLTTPYSPRAHGPFRTETDGPITVGRELVLHTTAPPTFTPVVINSEGTSITTHSEANFLVFPIQLTTRERPRSGTTLQLRSGSTIYASSEWPSYPDSIRHAILQPRIWSVGAVMFEVPADFLERENSFVLEVHYGRIGEASFSDLVAVRFDRDQVLVAQQVELPRVTVGGIWHG